MAALNRRLSAASLANALAVRKPDRLLSISWLMWPVFSLAAAEARDIRPRMVMATVRKMGMVRATTRASCQRMEAITTRAPAMVSALVSRSSGPWWASSVSSNRSVVSRDMSLPVRFLS